MNYLRVCQTAIAAITLGFLASLVCADEPATAPAKALIPNDAAIKDAEKLVNEVYGDDISKAKSPQEKVTLAKTLLLAAIDTKKDAAGTYVLLSRAKSLAAGVGGGRDAIALIDQINPLLDEAITENRYDVAKQLAEVVMASAQLINKLDWGGIKAAMGRVQAVNEIVAAQSKAIPAAETNLAVGKYYCLAMTNWDKGLPLLANGNDPVLKSISERELAKPAEAGKQLELGNGWWDWAEKQTGNTKESARLRAVKWYRLAVPELDGLQAAKVLRRLRDLQMEQLVQSLEWRVRRGMTWTGAWGDRTLYWRLRLRVTEDNMAAKKKGIEYLWSQQQPEGTWAGMKDYPVGPTALVVYALLQCGESPQSDRMKKALMWLATHKAAKTHEIGIRCNVWETANTQTKGKYFDCLKNDADMLVKSTKDGSYTYDATGNPAVGGDNSNSQYGLMGMLGAVQGWRYEVADEYWLKVMRHWMDSQNADGGWPYDSKQKESTVSMTCAGITSLLICAKEKCDWYNGRPLHDPKDRKLKPACIQAIGKGLEWLDQNLDSGNQGMSYPYLLFELSQAGVALETDFIGKKEWYKWGADYLLSKQQADGSFDAAGPNDTVKLPPAVQTAFALLFLNQYTHSDKPVVPDKNMPSTFTFNGEKAHHVVFCIDTSGWLDAPQEPHDILDIVKKGMIHSISHLNDSQDFHIIGFGEGPPIELPAKRLQPVTPQNRIAAAHWLSDVVAGCSGDPVPALNRCFDVLANADKTRKGKVIFLLSNGVFPDNDAVMRCIRERNKSKDVHVFTCLYEHDDETIIKLMKDIASETGGKYTSIMDK